MNLTFSKEQVDKVNKCLQNHMLREPPPFITADQGAILLANRGILTARPPKPGYIFREMLRQGRDGKIPQVSGAYQERPHTKWLIFRVSFENDEYGFIVASVPALPGCYSQGKTKEDAIVNINEAIRGYIASMRKHGESISNIKV